MSKTLAPIHYGLYKKIVLFENIERLIVERTSRAQGHQILVGRFGDYLPYTKLEDIIDPMNIHGWLQEKINIAENRQAALVYALMQDNVKLLDMVREAYFDVGLETGSYFKADNVQDLYKVLNEVLLDGMPCDGVSKILNQTDMSIQWQTVKDVHQDNWSSQGVDVDLYYQFRVAFTKGFLQGITKDYLYKFAPEYKLHEIKRIESLD